MAALGGGLVVSVGSSSADVTAVRGSACGYYVNVGLFGGPQNLRGCGQAGNAPGTATSPNVTLPAGGSATPITETDADGATAQYGPARIFSGRWPEAAASAPPSGPISVSTQGTTGPGGSVTSSVDIVLRTPANPISPGGFGPGPVEGDELHATCSANETSVTGSTRFVGGLLWTSTDAEGSPVNTEPIPNNPPPNYTRHGVLTNVGDVFSVVFNEQIVNADGSLTVNGFHMYLFGPTAVGESIGGQVTCGTTPTTVSPNDTIAPTCGTRVVTPVAPDDPTPRVPRQELNGVFDAGGLQTITNVQITNGTVHVPPNGTEYFQFNPGQRGPLPVTATRTDDAEAAGLTMTWSFDATDVAGNTTHCDGVQAPPPTTTTTQAPGGSNTTQATGATSTTAAPGATTTTTRASGTTTTTRQGGQTTTTAPTATTQPSSTTTQPPQHQLSTLAKTGALLRPLGLLAALGLVLGTLFLLRPTRTAASVTSGARSVRAPAIRPETWGPGEIGRALKGLVAAVLVSAAELIRRRRPPKGRG